MKAKAWTDNRMEFPQIKFHHPSTNNYVYINGHKFPSLPRDDRGRTCKFHKDLPEFITSQYTAFSYTRKEERCILCKNFRMGSDNRDVHVKCDSQPPRAAHGLPGSRVLPLKIHKAVTYSTTSRPADPTTRSYSTPATRGSRTTSRTISRTSKSRQCRTRMTCSPPSRLSTRESTKGMRGSVRSSLDESTLPPLYNEDTSALSPSYCRKFNSPVEHLQPLVKIDYLLGSMRSVMNPVYVESV